MYNQRLIKDRPAYFYPLTEGDTAFDDEMGSGPAQINGTPLPSPTLVAGGGNSYVFTGNDNFRFLSRVFGDDSVQTPFSLEAWFKPVSVNTSKGIVGHYGQADGLVFDGESISFTTFHGESGHAAAKYFPTYTTGSFHAVGVHTGSKNELYVNGERVASVDLTPEQMISSYQVSSAPGYLYVGHLPGSIIIDSVAIYSRALPSDVIYSHFIWGRDIPDFKDVVKSHGGNYWSFTDDTVDVIFDFKFDTKEEWATGVTTSVSTETDSLSPAYDDSGTTREGSWQAGFILGAIADTIDGSKIEWDSDGSVSVQTSVSGGNFTNAVNGREVSGLGQGFNTVGEWVDVRVSFPAGESADTISVMRSLSIKLYGSRQSSSNISGQDAKIGGNFSLASHEHQPIEQEDRAGLDLYAANFTTKGVSTRTIEMWLNLSELPGVDEYIFDARPRSNAYLRYSGSQWSTSSSTVLYVNGEERAGAAITLLPDRWTHIVALLPSPTNEDIIIGDRRLSMKVGMYANYDYTMSSNQVLSLYRSYLGISSLSIVEDSGLRLLDVGSPGIKIYTYPWTLRSSG